MEKPLERVNCYWRFLIRYLFWSICLKTHENYFFTFFSLFFFLCEMTNEHRSAFIYLVLATGHGNHFRKLEQRSILTIALNHGLNDSAMVINYDLWKCLLIFRTIYTNLFMSLMCIGQARRTLKSQLNIICDILVGNRWWPFTDVLQNTHIKWISYLCNSTCFWNGQWTNNKHRKYLVKALIH